LAQSADHLPPKLLRDIGGRQSGFSNRRSYAHLTKLRSGKYEIDEEPIVIHGPRPKEGMICPYEAVPRALEGKGHTFDRVGRHYFRAFLRIIPRLD